MLGKLTKGIFQKQYSVLLKTSMKTKALTQTPLNCTSIKSIFAQQQQANQKHFLLSFQKRSFSEESSKVINEEQESAAKEYKETNKQQMGFKAETKKLLDIVTHSLYTDKEIFLRELLSNCSDALEKQRFMEVNGKIEPTGEPLLISVVSNEKARTITIFDSGIGMTREEMIDNLGTIAKSGTQNFVKSVKEQQKEGFSNESLIGQFGVGFYSSFIVGDTVEVVSRPQGQPKAFHWVSDGNGEFQISDIENPDFLRGTKVVIHLKTDCRDFARPAEIQKIIKKHSNFISYSIKVNGEVINNVQAIWYRDKKDIAAEEYQKFFELLSGNSKNAYKYLLHFSSDVPLDIKALLYIPGVSMEKFGMSDDSTGLSLYSKKVLIKPKCNELLPNYFRFVKGVVDCADIPLALSRESYQDSSLIYRLKVLITKRILKKLEEEIIKDADNYNTWYEDFQQYLREGIMTDQDNQKNLFKLLRFKATFSTNKKIGIEDYLKQVREGQNKIYYIIIPNDNDIESNIFLENFKGSILPILITNTPLDDMIFRQINEYNNLKFLNIENETDDFLTNFKTESGSVVNRIPDDDITPYTLWIKNELEPFVTKVSISKRLKDSPILITSAISTHMKTFMAMMSQGKDGAVSLCFFFFSVLFVFII